MKNQQVGMTVQTNQCRRASRTNPTGKATQRYNDKKSRRMLAQLINANFTPDDLLVTCAYAEGHLPRIRAAALVELQTFLRGLRTIRKSRGDLVRYVYSTEQQHGPGTDAAWGEDCALEDHRLHHHLILNGTGPDKLDELRELWRPWGVLRIEPLATHTAEELARYMTKEDRVKQAWTPSRGLNRTLPW